MSAVLATPAPPPEAGVYRFMAPRRRTTPRVVRDWVTCLCRDAGFEGLVEDARLCVSEAVTNVVLHTHTAMVVTDVMLRERGISVNVYDNVPNPVPVPYDHYSDEEKGRGLRIVESLSEQWGVTYFCDLATPGKAVWFRLDEKGLGNDRN
ncbi:ATP-binding protein [Streptomyces sp. NPDC054863]